MMINMHYNALLQELKNKHYKDLKNIKIELKPLKLLRKTFMIVLPFSTNIYYNKKIIKKCNDEVLKAVLMHELYHIVQFKKINFLQKLIFIPRYHLNKKFRKEHELEAHIVVMEKGFGKELMELNKFVMSRYTKKVWEKKLSDCYLAEEEIKHFMHKNLANN